MKDNPEARELAEKIRRATFDTFGAFRKQHGRDPWSSELEASLVPILSGFIESKNAALAEANKRIKELEEKVDELVGELQ